MTTKVGSPDPLCILIIVCKSKRKIYNWRVLAFSVTGPGSYSWIPFLSNYKELKKYIQYKRFKAIKNPINQLSYWHYHFQNSLGHSFILKVSLQIRYYLGWVNQPICLKLKHGEYRFKLPFYVPEKNVEKTWSKTFPITKSPYVIGSPWVARICFQYLKFHDYMQLLIKCNIFP